MSITRVREYLKQWHKDQDIIEFSLSTATVALAAEALQVAPARIGKSLTFRAETGARLVVVCGDQKIDNRKYKQHFGQSPKMLNPDEAFQFTGLKVGGICPFGLPADLAVYLDVSLRRFESIYLACGDANSMIELATEELMTYSGARGWVDVCKENNS